MNLSEDPGIGLVERSPYPRITLLSLPRAFTLQDLNPLSRTYGCCDRGFWNYKTVTDFPSGAMQQLALAFAILYSVPFEENTYHGDPVILERARSAMLYWARTMHRSGAVDEWYRNEISYCATAFTTFGMAESLRMLGGQLDPSDIEVLKESVLRAARWLAKRFNPWVMNQNLAACVALWSAFVYTGEPWLRSAAVDKWEKTLKYWNPEGWFCEYGGPDLGYSTLALDLLALLGRSKCSVDLLGTAGDLCQFIASFICRSGDLAGGLGSRGTCHTFPYGTEVFAQSIPAATCLAAHLRREFGRGNLVSPENVDDRYLAYFYLPQFALACTATPLPEPCALLPSSDRYWSASRFVISHSGPADLVCSLNRNGAFNLYASGLPCHRNWGYWVETEDGERWTSAGWVSDAITHYGVENGRIDVSGPFVRVDDSLPLERWGSAFHFVSRWLFRSNRLAELSQHLIKERKIATRKPVPLTIDRQIFWEGSDLCVCDRIHKSGRVPVFRRLAPAADFEAHSPSARMGSGLLPECIPVGQTNPTAWAQRLSQEGVIRLKATYAQDALGRMRFRSMSEMR